MTPEEKLRTKHNMIVLFHWLILVACFFTLKGDPAEAHHVYGAAAIVVATLVRSK